MKHSQRRLSKLLIPVLSVFLIVLLEGCASTPVPNSYPNALMHWQPNDQGRYIHVSGSEISEDRYARMVAHEIDVSLQDLTKSLQKNCKRSMP